MNVPPVVYLDSSDWSNLSSAVGDWPFADRDRWLQVRKRLLAAKAERKAEFRFSQAIVVEAYPLSAEHHLQGLGRARTIAEFCGPLCLVESGALTRSEARQLASGEAPPFPRDIAYRDDGGWHGNPDDLGVEMGAELLGDLNPMIRKLVCEALPNSDERARSAYVRQLINRDGKLTALGRIGLTDSSWQVVKSEAAAKLGIPPDFPGIDVILKVIRSEVPPSEADKFMVSLLRNLPVLFALDETRRQADGLFGWLRLAGRSITEPMAEGRQLLIAAVANLGLATAKRLAQEAPALDVDRWRAKTRKHILAGIWEAEQKLPRRSRARGKAWWELVDPSLPGAIPSLDACLAATAGLLRRSIQPSAQPRQPRESDIGDMLHMSYLPYVDVFRCDGFGAGIAQEVIVAMGLATRVTRTIEEALAVIEPSQL